MIRWLRARRADERGFTLVELMMAIALTGVVIAPLAAGIVVGLRTGDEAYNRVAGSNAAQLLSVWLPPDLQSAGPNSDDVVGAPTPNTAAEAVGGYAEIPSTRPTAPAPQTLRSVNRSGLPPAALRPLFMPRHSRVRT